MFKINYFPDKSSSTIPDLKYPLLAVSSLLGLELGLQLLHIIEELIVTCPSLQVISSEGRTHKTISQ